MVSKNRYRLAWLCVQLPVLACAQLPARVYAGDSGTVRPTVTNSGPVQPAIMVSEAEREARRCQPHAGDRNVKNQGTMLWGTRRSWRSEQTPLENGRQESTSVLVSVGLTSPARGTGPGNRLKLEGGHLTVSSASGSALKGDVVGTVLEGKASDGTPVEVSICAAEPSVEDPSMVRYQIEVWNTLAQEWDNPCVALGDKTPPKALAVGGVWDATGAHQDAPDRFTFACVHGSIAKCADWGYKPWVRYHGHSLADFHQSCTRMARADYCGDGVNHTYEDTAFDMYDSLGMISRTTESSAEWDLKRASFEAAWAPDGATCVARTRHGLPLETLLRQCPQRFALGAPLALGAGDVCQMQRKDQGLASPLLRNWSYVPARSSGPGETTP